MGLFDNLFKGFDDVLKDIEEGGIEKRLDNIAGMIDHGSKQVFDATDRFVKAPEKMLKRADDTSKEVEHRIVDIRQRAGKAMDIVRPKIF